MRVVTLFALLFVATFKGFATPGEVLEYSLVKSFPAPELKAYFKKHKIPKVVLPVNVGINVYEVVYTSTYADNSDVKASGLLYVPMMEGKELPLMIYNHGTEMCRERSCDFTGEQIIGLAFAADGYVVMVPDYMGMGVGDRTQLYLNADAESRSSVDMLIASKSLLPKLNITCGKQLFVTGYSQGGHAAMATHRLLQQKYADQFPVTASSPMSGPYDIERTVYESRDQQFEFPGFFFLLLQSYFESQGKQDEMPRVLNPPFDKTVPPLLDGNYPVQEIDKILPNPVFKALKPNFVESFINDSTSGFRQYLYKNNVFNWKPEAPMQLCYCQNDEEVNYKNSITAYRAMKKNGSDKVELWRAGKKFGHVNCALFAVIYTKMFFDEFREGHPGKHGPAFKQLLVSLGKMGVPAN